METGGAGSALETITREIAMNWDQVEGKWKQYAGNVRRRSRWISLCGVCGPKTSPMRLGIGSGGREARTAGRFIAPDEFDRV